MVCPWDITALDCGQDLDADQEGLFRVFKSHETYENIAKGGRYIYVVRNPEDAFVSFYNFLPKYMHCSVSVEDFATAIFGGLSHSGGIWSHFVGWMGQGALVVSFEDLKRDLPGQIKRVADFLGVDPIDPTLASYEYMSSRQTQFDDHFVFDKLKHKIGIDGEHQTSKVQSGTVGRRADLPPAVLDMLHARWANTVKPALHVDNYDDFCAKFIQH